MLYLTRPLPILMLIQFKINNLKMRLPFARYGWKEIMLFGSGMTVGCALSIFLFPYLCPIFLSGLFFVLWFFRDPDRVVPRAEEVLISPADGTIVEISRVFEADYLKDDAIKIGIFMSIMDVHVNRMPYSGRVVYIKYKNGRFFDARLPEAAVSNEHNMLGIEIDNDRGRIMIKQIAGRIARRIVCDCAIEQFIRRGERIGMIKFGSRVEVYIPEGINFSVAVKIGQKVRAGETILGVKESKDIRME